MWDGVLFGFLFSSILSLFLSPALWEVAQVGLKYNLEEQSNPKQPTNQLTYEILPILSLTSCELTTSPILSLASLPKDV